MITDILQFVILALVGYFIGKWILYLWHAHLRNQLAQYQEVIDRLNDIIHEVRVETHDEGMSYWFDSHSDEFLAQGRDLDEIISVLKVRFPDHVFLVPGQGGMGAGTDWRLVDDKRLQNAMIAAKAWRHTTSKESS
jgi:hypothetical protein